MEEKNEELQTNFGATRWSIWSRGDRGRPCAQLYQQFLLIVQLVAGKHMLNPQSVAEKHVFFGDHESKDIRTIQLIVIKWQL